MTLLPPSPFLSAVAHPATVVEAAARSPQSPLVVAAADLSESSVTERRVVEAPLAAPPNTVRPAGFLDQENYIPELFLHYAQRRCMSIISPPLKPREYEVDMDALYDKIVPVEPPVFLRSPSQNFIRALFELGR